MMTSGTLCAFWTLSYSDGIWYFHLRCCRWICMSLSNWTISRVLVSRWFAGSPYSCSSPWGSSEKIRLYIAIWSRRTYYFASLINLGSKLLTLAQVHTKMTSFTLIYSRGSIGHPRLCLAFVIRLLLICGHSGASFTNFLSDSHCSQVKTRRNKCNA